MRHKRRVAVVCAVSALGGGAAVAVAAVPDSSGKIYACLDVSTTTGGLTVPNQSAANLTVIDPSVGQHCIPPDGPSAPNQQTITWNQQGPQGPAGPTGSPGAQGPAGTSGAPGATGATGAGGLTVTAPVRTLVLASPALPRNAGAIADVTLGSGRSAISFPILADQEIAPGASVSAGSANRSTRDILLTKTVDKASPKLFLACATGRHFYSAVITLRRKTASTSEYLVLRFTNAVISSFETAPTSGGAAAPVKESVSLNFSKIETTYVPQKTNR